MVGKVYKYILITIFTFIIVNIISAQNDTIFEEFIIGNKIYKRGSNWLKISEGIGYHFSLQQVEYNTTIAYSFRIKKFYFQLGYHVSSDVFFTKPSLQKLNDIYICSGIRKEHRKADFASFVGISYAYGATFDHSEWKNGTTSNWYRGFACPGLFITIDYTYKFTYDMGIGISTYGSINQQYNVVGLQLYFYISGAYRGQIK